MVPATLTRILLIGTVILVLAWPSLFSPSLPPFSPVSDVAMAARGSRAFTTLGRRTNLVMTKASTGMAITVTIIGNQALKPPAAGGVAPAFWGVFVSSGEVVVAITTWRLTLFHVYERLKHFITGRNDLGVCFKRALGRNQISHLIGEVHVGKLQRARLHAAQSTGSRRGHRGQRARSRRIGVKVVADVDQLVRVLKILQQDLPAHERGAVGKVCGHLALAVNRIGSDPGIRIRSGGHAGRIDPDVSQRVQSAVRITLNAVAGNRDEIAVGIHLESAVAGGVGGAGHGVPDHEKAAARDGEVALDPGGGERSLVPIVLDAVDGDAGADLHGIGAARGGAAAIGGAQGVAESISEGNGGGFETGGVNVGNIVADDIHLVLEAFQPADA